MSTPTALVVGATGLVGSQILSVLRAGAPSPYTSVEVLARRALPPAASADAAVPVKEFTDADLTKWGPHLASSSPAASTFFSSLATTRATAGGFDKQYKLEHDFNLDLAKTAKEAGVKTFVLISSGGADAKSMFGYPRMKGEIEDHIKELSFDHTIILRPGLLLGHRQESRPTEKILQNLAWGMGHIHSSLRNVWAQDAETIARAAVLTAARAEKGEIKEKVIVLGQSDIIRIGGKEWKELAH
ncbi:hypothetical protein, variant [Exophiala mesophila]|uniref:NAD(P)-binding domain-containing protein n=1 Tax=Exophiala mesophila TaxID=212818 RepID=A0A0D1Z983_EXOME|nr:uncharacterized protein PV10_07865 [Exophiala mesophila]XP_016222153.1 hypothetical protein, variant [Exophiala mesophila]KIV90578.1 hypothetical protein PV10_07865 [Exophiala mesophila]KIV90579.1 hypothetical protein, variant [Exophiala mesophila]